MERPEENDMNTRHPELWDEPDHIRKEMARTMDHIYSHGMTTTSGGNMSVIDSLGNIWITPSGTDKGSLRPDEIVCVAPDGTFEGALKPSVEYPLHHAVYNARPDIRAVIHAHPPMLTSFSIVHRIPDTSVIREWREICGTAGYAGYATPGTGEMGENVAAQFIEGHNVVIMENHAAVAGGKDLAEALARLETLEYCARTLHAAAVIGEIRIPDNDMNDNPELTGGSQLPHSGSGKYPCETESVMTPEEERLSDEICRIAERACSRGLMYGFCGDLSARRSGDSFLITRDGIVRYDIKKRDIIRGGAGTDDIAIAGSPGTGPASWLHGEIYRRFRSVNAVITARPPYLMAFAVTGKEIDVRTIPESWLLLQEMPSLPPDALQPGREDVFASLTGGIPAVMIRNDLVTVTGDSLLQAFDRLEVAEMTAMSLVLSQSLGKVQPIAEEQINALRKSLVK